MINELIRILSLFLAMIGIGFWGLWTQYNNHRWRYAVSPLVWLTHIVVFFGMRLIFPGLLDSEIINRWKLVIIVHSVIVVASGGIVMWVNTRNSVRRGQEAYRILNEQKKELKEELNVERRQS